MNQAQALYRLQVLESSIDAAKSRVSEIEKALEQDENVRRCQLALETCNTTLHEAQVAATRAEQELEGLKAKILEGETMLYGGGIRNPRELKEKQTEIESLKNRQTTLDADFKAAQASLGKAQSAQEEASAALGEAQTASAANYKNLVRERDKAKTQMSEWLASRKDLLKIIQTDNYQTYKQLKPQKKGVAVAQLDDEDMCTFCRVEQTQVIAYQVRQGKLIPCSNCGRILVVS